MLSCYLHELQYFFISSGMGIMESKPAKEYFSWNNICTLLIAFCWVLLTHSCVLETLEVSDFPCYHFHFGLCHSGRVNFGAARKRLSLKVNCYFRPNSQRVFLTDSKDCSTLQTAQHDTELFCTIISFLCYVLDASITR